MIGGLADTLKADDDEDRRPDGDARARRSPIRSCSSTASATRRVLREKADDTNVRLSTMTQEMQALRQTIASMPRAAVARTGHDGDPGAVRPGARQPRRPAPGGPPPNISPTRMFDQRVRATTPPASTTWRSRGSRRSSARSRRRRRPTMRSCTSATRYSTHGQVRGGGRRLPEGDHRLPAERQRAVRLLQARARPTRT